MRVNKQLSIISKLKDKGFFHLTISNYSVQFIVFGSHLLVAKIMTATDVGIIKTIEVFSNMAIVLGGGGAIFAILKVIPEHKNLNVRRAILKFSLKYVALFSLGIFIFFNILAYFGLMSQDKELVKWLHQYSLLIIPSAIIILLIRYYQSVDRFKRISTVIFYLKLVSAIFVLFFTYFLFIKGYIFSMVVSTTVTALALLYDLKNELFVNSFVEEYRSLKETFINLSKTAFYAQVIDQLKLHSGFLIANYILTDRIMFGHYAFALILIQGLNIISTSVQQFIIPKMSEVSAYLSLFFKKQKQIENKFVLLSFFIFSMAQLLFPVIITFVFNDKYDDSILLLRIMLVGWLIQSLYALKGIVFLSLGKMKYISYASLLIFLISVPVMYFLNEKYGAIGAASSYVFQNVISFFVVSFYLKKVSKY